MIKRTIAIENPSRLSVKHDQLIIEQDGTLAGKIPIEDIGVLLIDNPAVLYTHGCLMALLDNNAAVILSAKNHHPTGLLLPLDTNSVQSERFQEQIKASVPLKKALWKQTVQTKIKNQARFLEEIGEEPARLKVLAKNVKAGDPSNLEAQASRYYWPRLFGNEFRRERFGKAPNNLLNYGYMVLRAAVARSLVSSGLLPTLGIHHHNRYNAYCLADDIMEPYRPFVDKAVYQIIQEEEDCETLNKEMRQELLQVLTTDVRFEKETRPLTVGLHHTTASVYRCFAGEQKKIDYPVL